MTKTAMPSLTAAQDKALRAFAAMAKNDAPSIQEWANRLGLNYSTVHQHRSALVEMGLLTERPGRARSTKITPLGQRYVSRRRALA